MRHLVGIVIAGVAFAVGTGAVRGVEFGIGEIWPVGEEVRLPEAPPADFVIDSVLFKPIQLRVNGVGIGTSEKEMLRLLGKPGSVEKDSGSDRLSTHDYTYPGLTIEVVGYKGKWTVEQINVSSGSWNISGFSIGSSVDAVKRAIGRPMAEYPGEIVYVDTSDFDIDIDIENGRVSRVFVSYDDC